MKIHLETSGGLEGIVTNVAIDTRFVSLEESSKLTELVDKSNFFELPRFIPTESKGSDHFNYKIAVETEKRDHIIERNDFTIEPQLYPLIDFLRGAT